MTNTKFLKKKLIDAGYCNSFVNAISDLLNISRTTASKKLNGKTDFTQSELSVLSVKLDISASEVKENFLEGESCDG